MLLHSFFSAMVMGTRGIREQCPVSQILKLLQLFALRTGVTTVNSVPALHNSEKQIGNEAQW